MAAATSRWEPTFSDFLNEQLQGNLSCEFTMMPYAEPIDLLSAVQAGQLDFVFVNPSLHECLQVRGLCTAQCVCVVCTVYTAPPGPVSWCNACLHWHAHSSIRNV